MNDILILEFNKLLMNKSKTVNILFYIAVNDEDQVEYLTLCN